MTARGSALAVAGTAALALAACSPTHADMSGSSSAKASPRVSASPHATRASGPTSAPFAQPHGRVVLQAGRLSRTYFSTGWARPSLALDSFRVDPVSARVRPQQSGAAILAKLRSTGVVTPGAVVRLRFGTFTGNQAIVGPPPNYRLNGARPITGVRAWLVVISNIEVAPVGGMVGTGTQPPAPPPRLGYAVTVVSDASGALLSVVAKNTGAPPSLA